MIDVNDLRKGVTFLLDGSLYKVLDYHHNKPGRGNATIKVKAKDLRTGTTLEKTFNSGFRVEDVRLDYHNVQYLYNDEAFYYFMDIETFEQPAIPASLIADSAGYLTENLEVKLTFLDSEPIDIELPTSVDLVVVEAEASVRGDTATGVTKKVKVETGIYVDVPAFIVSGQKIRINTSTGEYVTRVSE